MLYYRIDIDQCLSTGPRVIDLVLAYLHQQENGVITVMLHLYMRSGPLHSTLHVNWVHQQQ